MRTSTFNSSVPKHIHSNFRTIDKPKVDLIELSLRNNYFVRFAGDYLSTDWGKNDLENHLFRRLDTDRNMIVPWLDDARPLRRASILEIGCGTGCSTVALAEQGARVTAIDVDASSLVVASERCRAYSLDVSFAHANATEVSTLFAGQRFDYIIFYAALEHMTMEERMSAMRATWQMLSVGGLWCVIETPNRLWYYDAHTSLLPFHMWLPDELAFAYSQFSPRDNYRELYREYTDEAKLHFLRRGRGVSFHEFELTMKPVRELRIKSSLNVTNRERGLWGLMKWRFSNECRYISLLRRIAPELHEGFLQSVLYLIIEKD
jgi:2-polyprenyl-3-methyl-5-hydroxy-6-metoxy-1,4-benzoquinol methylase